MISRTWHGLVPLEMKEGFYRYLEATGVKDATSLSGNKGAIVKVIDQGNYAHFFLCTLWDKLEDVILFAGVNPTVAVTYPEDQKYGLISDPIVIHQEIMHVHNPFSFNG